MRLGSLSALPLTASDFASACFTASVPRKYLKLILVRVIVTDARGDVDAANCRTTALLFDARHKMAALHTAIVGTVRESRRTSTHHHAHEESTAHIERLQVYTRISGSVVPVTFGGESAPNGDALPRHFVDSVYMESFVSGGRLRGSVHMGGALRAYQNHCSVKSTVCIETVSRIYKNWPRESAALVLSAREHEYANMYVSGLRRLGVANPTAQLPDDCECTRKSQCSCFMARAMWRAGNSWMILYAVLPPTTGGCSPPTPARSTSGSTNSAAGGWGGAAPRGSPRGDLEWVDKLIDVAASESEDAAAATNPFDAIDVRTWSLGFLECSTKLLMTRQAFSDALVHIETMMVCTDRAGGSRAQTSGASLDSSESDSASFSSLGRGAPRGAAPPRPPAALFVEPEVERAGVVGAEPPPGVGGAEPPVVSLIESCLVRMLAQPAFLGQSLGSIAKTFTLYYKAVLMHVLIKSQRRQFYVRVLKRARLLGAYSQSLFEAIRYASNAHGAVLTFVHATSGLASKESRKHSGDMAEAYETTGYTMVIAIATILSCSAQQCDDVSSASSAERMVNTWHDYAMLPQLTDSLETSHSSAL